MNLHGKIPQHTSRGKNKINAVIYIEGWPGNARKKAHSLKPSDSLSGFWQVNDPMVLGWLPLKSPR